LEKGATQAPLVAAADLWEQILKMPSEGVEFIEDLSEDVELAGLAGITCVERMHVVAVRINSKPKRPGVKSQEPDRLGDEHLKNVGLPEHSDFSCDDALSHDEDGEVKRKFKWMSLADWKSLNRDCDYGVLSNASVDANDQPIIKGRKAIDHLKSFLRKDRRINVEGMNNRGKLQLLWSELNSGKCHLQHTAEGITRIVDVVCMRVWSPDGQLVLVDRGRQNVAGDQEWKAQLPGLKKQNKESLAEVAEKILENPLQLHVNDVQFPHLEDTWQHCDHVENSARFDGLRTMYRQFFVDGILDDRKDLLQDLCLQSGVQAASQDSGGMEAWMQKVIASKVLGRKSKDEASEHLCASVPLTVSRPLPRSMKAPIRRTQSFATSRRPTTVDEDEEDEHLFST
jgi:hypothetical protein